MAGTFKTSFFFEGVQNVNDFAGKGASGVVGWTETWYQTVSGNIDAALTNAEVDRYIALRTAFLSPIYSIPWVRCSDVANPRSSKTKGVNAPGRYGTKSFNATTANRAGQVTCAVLVDFARLPTVPKEPVHHRRFLIRALPVDMIVGNILTNVSDSYKAFKKFLIYMGGHETGTNETGPNLPYWQLQFLDPLLSVNWNLVDLVPVVANPKTVTITSDALLLAARGARFIVSRVKEPRGVNRTWTVLTPPAGGSNVAVLGTSRFGITGTYDHQGQIRPANFGYGVPQQYLIIGLRTKHTGRPFHLTRGRRRIL